MSRILSCIFVLAVLPPFLCFSNVLGTVRVMVHDPLHRPIPGARAELRAQRSEWVRTAVTDENGELKFMAVPAGEYVISLGHAGFQPAERAVRVESGAAPILHFALSLAEMKLTVEVTAAPELVNADSSTTSNMVNRREIDRTPGADRTNSLAMITAYVPGSYMVHDQLHIRGGHQVTWLVDGVPVMNTNIAGNVGPRVDPKDIDYLEVQRGGYSAEYGDRAFGVFNVVPRSGFERNKEIEVAAGYGNHETTDSQFSLGSHTERTAYYLSLTGNRSDIGLQTPEAGVIHDRSRGFGGFSSLLANLTPVDQIRLVASVRGDRYQVPNTAGQQTVGIRDVQLERDAFANVSWLHTIGSGTLLTIAPFFHRNRAAFEGSTGDAPVIAESDRTSTYAGGLVSVSMVTSTHNARVGATATTQRDHVLLGLQAAGDSGRTLRQTDRIQAAFGSAYLEDQYRPVSWLTLNGGMRISHFSGRNSENAVDPRLGAAIRMPHLNWVVRGFYGRYYQPPPLSTASGPVEEAAVEEGFGFLPLRGERDEEYEAGLAVPVSGWALDFDYFHLKARNYFDHDALGNSNIFFPLTIANARVRGWEATVRSPRLFGRGHVHLAYSHQFAQGSGAVTGGLTDFSPPEEGLFYLDHDQRDTLSGGAEIELPRQAWISSGVSYGSGFLDEDGPAHLPHHTTFDLSVGKSFSERLSLRLTALNIANRRFLLDNSNTFGGTHYNYPREISLTLRYRFNY